MTAPSGPPGRVFSRGDASEPEVDLNPGAKSGAPFAVIDYGAVDFTTRDPAWCRRVAAAWTRAAELLEQEVTIALPDLASCGHPRNEDGECDCSSWPERAAL